MPDSNVEPAESIAPPAVDAAASLARLQASSRRHLIWLIVLTVFMALALCGVISVVGMTFGIGAVFEGPDMASDEQISEAEREIEAAYGAKLQDLEVRGVEVTYGDVPFPYSIMSGGDMESLYIEYELKGSDVVVADLLEAGFYGDGLSSSGMIPTKGSLVSRMEIDQFERLLAAYGAETTAPLGSIRRYGDKPYYMETGTSIPDELTVGDKSYPTKELWTANEGRIIEGDSVDMNDEEGMGRSALIFREDTATGEFEFLGTEPMEPIW